MFTQTISHFLHHLGAVSHASKHTLRNYATDLKIFQAYVKEQTKHLLVKDVDKKTIRGFLSQLYTKGQSKRTIARRLATLRSFFKHCCAQKWLEQNPTEELENPRLDKKIPTSLTYEQIKYLFEQPDTTTYLGLRDRAILELFYSSGLRVGELVAINRSDCNFEELLIKIKGKGKKERITPITKNAATWMQIYLNQPERHIECNDHAAEKDLEAIFLNHLGTRLTTRSVDRNFEKYFKASGLAGRITPHTIRHTIATHWLENGMDLKTIQALLGHSNVATTTIYTQVSPKLKTQIYQKTHPRA